MSALTHSRRRTGRSLVRAALAAAITAFALTAPSEAATYATTVSPDPFSYSANQQLVYRLQITTGAAPETLRVSSDAGPSFPNGGKLMSLEPMELEGPGTVVHRGGTWVIADRFCVPEFPDTHGNLSFFTPTLEVDVPANSTSAIALPARLNENAPWRGMDLAVEFTVGQTPMSAEVVRSPSPMSSGRHGLPISFRTDPRGGTSGACLSFPVGPPPSVASGKDVLVNGKTDPAAAGQLMTIRAARRDEGPRDLATVRIGGDGSFGYRWRPSTPGDYAIGALYRSQSPALTDDFSEATTLRIAPPRTSPPPDMLRPVAITAVRRVRCRGRRCAIVVRGSVKRPQGALAACRGDLRLRVAAGRRRLLSTRLGVGKNCRYRARRRFTLRSRRTRAVKVRVSYLGDTVFLPKRGRAVRVKIRR